MSDNISLTAESWYGTQMKPDIFEPATAEWAGRTAKNAGWLFARQQQVLFDDGLDRAWSYTNQYLPFQWFFRRRFWLNEIYGTFLFHFNLEMSGDTDLAVVQGTLTEGYGNGWDVLGTCEGSYVSGGWKTLWIYTDPDWHKSTIDRDYGSLLIRCSLDGLAQGKEAIFRYMSFTGFTRT